MEDNLLIYALIGFCAQLVDSALGMAFGSLSSSLLLAIGFPAQSLSATVHMAEIFGGSASALSHWRMGNIDMPLLKKLAVPALAGAILGAFMVTQFDNKFLYPLMGIYFSIIGSVIVLKALRPEIIRTMKTRRETIGFIGGFLDAFGGAGWGEFVSSGLLLRGYDTRKAIGSIVAVEFMIAIAVSVILFSTMGISLWAPIIALALGAIAAAPIGAYVCRRTPSRLLTLGVGSLIAVIGVKTLIQSF